jgi:hypothetical protein
MFVPENSPDKTSSYAYVQHMAQRNVRHCVNEKSLAHIRTLRAGSFAPPEERLRSG